MTGFFEGPQIGQVVDQEGFYDGPAYTQMDPVAIASYRDQSAASAAAAATSATNAASSASASASSATVSDSSRATAVAAATVAAGQATVATTQAGNASTSASNAATSETNAANSASAASSSASAASTSASNASTSAGNAAGSASAASTSASNAHTSEVNAAGSASAASTSATNAAGAVQAAAGTATPLVAAGTGSVGTSTKWAHEDHVHPTDTTRAPIASPTFTGLTVFNAASGQGFKITGNGSVTPSKFVRVFGGHFQIVNDANTSVLLDMDDSGLLTANAVTQSVGDNSTKLATTAFVLANSPARPTFRAKNTADQTVTAATWTKINLNSKDWDTNSFFDSTTNYRFTPTTSGYYLLTAQVTMWGGTGQKVGLGLFKNGALYGYSVITSAADVDSGVFGSAIIFFNGTTDYVELYGYSTGTTPKFFGSGNQCNLAGVMVR